VIIELPDGREIEVPDDSTQEQIGRAAKIGAGLTVHGPIARNHPAAPTAPDVPIATQQAIAAQARMSGPERFLMGVARPAYEAAYGLQQLVGNPLSDEQKHRMTVLEANKGAAGTSGRIAGDLGLSVLGGLGASSVAKRVLPKALAGLNSVRAAEVARKGEFVGDLAANTGLSGTQSVGRGEGFGSGAAQGALGTLGGAAAGKAVGTVARGMRPGSDLSLSLAKVGVPLTPGQWANGPVKWAENRLSALPIVGDAIKKRQMEAFEPWNREVLRKVTDKAGLGPENAAKAVTAGGKQGFAQADDAFKTQWNNLDARTIEAEGRKISGASARQKLNELEDAVSVARQGGLADLARTKKLQLDTLRESLDSGWLDQYDNLSKNYADLMTVARTAKLKGPRESGGVFTPAELLQSVAARTKGKSLARGESALGESAAAAQKVIGKSAPSQAERVLNPILAVAGGYASPLATAIAAIPALGFATKTGGKLARGAVPGQRVYGYLEDELSGVGFRGSTLANALRDWMDSTSDR